MTLFDANTWLGSWPFAFLPVRDARAHAAALLRAGISRALVSPLAAVFAPEPGPANAALLADTRPWRSLVPVPVINPALANWSPELDRVTRDPRVRAVRWLPAYHNYRLNGRRVSDCARALAERGLGLVLTARLVDERHEYFALRIRGLKPAALTPFLSAHANLRVLLTGLSRPDLVKLLPAHPHVLADTAYAEWERTLERLVAQVPVAQLVFGTQTPFLIAAAGVAKLTSAQLPLRQQRAVAADNLDRFLSR